MKLLDNDDQLNDTRGFEVPVNSGHLHAIILLHITFIKPKADKKKYLNEDLMRHDVAVIYSYTFLSLQYQEIDNSTLIH